MTTGLNRMKLAVRRRPLLPFLALLLLLCGLPRPSLAMSEITDASKERAKELGITVRSRLRASHDVWVQVEFKTSGQMKEFRYADLEVTQGRKRLILASLQPRKPAIDSPADRKLLEFYIDPAALPNSTVTIFVYNEPMSGIGYRLQMKDFPIQPMFR